MITGERNQFIGTHVTRPVKNQLRSKAMTAGMSMSEFVYHVLRKYLEHDARQVVAPEPEPQTQQTQQ